MADKENEHSAETLICDSGEELKSIETTDGKVRVGAYAVRFADKSEKDLTGDHFTKSTDFGPTAGNGVAAMFNHGIPIVKSLSGKPLRSAKAIEVMKSVAEMQFGAVKTTLDDVGLFAETVLDTSNEYAAMVAKMCEQGKLKWSSSTAEHVMRKSADGEITRWHPIEFSFTPKPAEPRLPAIKPLKSLTEEDLAEIAKAFSEAGDAETEKAAPTIEVVDSGAQSEPPTTAQTSMTDAERKAARELEITEMKSVGTHFKCVETAEDFIHLGKSLDDLRKEIAENVIKARPVTTDPTIGMSKKEVKSYSFLKALREAHAGRLSGLELEASNATAKAINRTPSGFFFPHDVAALNLAQSQDLGAQAMKSLADAIKNLNQTTFASGGALVGTNLLTGSMIELLRNKPLVAQMGARGLSGLVGNIAIPSVTGGATAYWLNEQGSVTASDQSFGQLGLTPKRLIGRTGYTKELMNQTDISVEAFVRDDITTVLALAKDLAAINGTGGSQPLGILNTTGRSTDVTFGAAATRAKAIEFQKNVAVNNASRGALAYLTTPTVAAKWLNISEGTATSDFVWKGNIDSGMVVGRRAESTNQVPSDKVIYGNFNDLILADWAGIDVVVNPYTNDATGVVTITITLWTDTGVRHAVSFCVSADSGAQ
jgi:HK97 family phage major capsid protein